MFVSKHSNAVAEIEIFFWEGKALNRQKIASTPEVSHNMLSWVGQVELCVPLLRTA